MDFERWSEALSRWAASRGQNVALLGTATSTNQIALDVATESEESGLEAWVFALHQSAGKGRFERPWLSPVGAGVYASWLLQVPRRALDLLPLLVGVGLCEALATFGFDCRLKWPNDLLLGGAKVGGILLQSRGSRDPAPVVAGFGVNHSHRARDLPASGATSLMRVDPGRLPELSTLAIGLAEAVEDAVEPCRGSHGWSPRHAVERYEAWTAHRAGDALRVRLGAEACEGEFVGFSAAGHLELLTPTGLRRFSAGEVLPDTVATRRARGSDA